MIPAPGSTLNWDCRLNNDHCINSRLFCKMSYSDQVLTAANFKKVLQEKKFNFLAINDFFWERKTFFCQLVTEESKLKRCSGPLILRFSFCANGFNAHQRSSQKSWLVSKVSIYFWTKRPSYIQPHYSKCYSFLSKSNFQVCNRKNKL